MRGIGARGTSGSRKDDVQGLGRTTGGIRGTSRAATGVGSAKERTGASKERPGLSFGKTAAEPKLDPSMTTVKKQELADLKEAAEQNEKHKEELYGLNVKYKQLEF